MCVLFLFELGIFLSHQKHLPLSLHLENGDMILPSDHKCILK